MGILRSVFGGLLMVVGVLIALLGIGAFIFGGGEQIVKEMFVGGGTLAIIGGWIS